MADKGKGKLKLLYILQYLQTHSDDGHPVSTEELMEMLRARGIDCERKSIYSDVQTLRDSGLDILRVKTPCNGYALASRTFEVPELRLLMDAVRAASFITPKKTDELIEKLGTLCSVHQAASLVSQVGGNHKSKYANEEIYYNIDTIDKAIALGKKIKFRYCKRQLDVKNRGVKVTEKDFTVSPYALIWSDDQYYLVSNHEKYDNLMHTRIDRMKGVHMISRPARPASEVSPYPDGFDAADYAAKVFHMFSGEVEPLELLCHNSLLEEMLDRFGTEITLTKSKRDEFFCLQAEGVVSDGLASWLMQFSDRVEVVSPASLRKKIKRRSEEIFALYKDNFDTETASDKAKD